MVEEGIAYEVEIIKKLELNEAQLRVQRATIKELQDKLVKKGKRVAQLERVLRAVENTLWGV